MTMHKLNALLFIIPGYTLQPSCADFLPSTLTIKHNPVSELREAGRHHERCGVVFRGRRDAGFQLPLIQRLRDHARARLRQVPAGVAAPDRVGEQQEVAHRVPLAGESLLLGHIALRDLEFSSK